MRNGEADAVIHEAIMTPWWQDLAKEQEIAFLPIEETDEIADQIRLFLPPRP